MKTQFYFTRRVQGFFLFIALVTTVVACSKDDDPPAMRSKTYAYAFNTGQVGAGTAYNGTHAKTLTATVRLDEQANNTTKVTVTLTNTVNGQKYPTHVHDGRTPTAGDPLPYVQTPNAGIFAAEITGNGGTATASNVSTMTYENLTTMYSGFFVVHDITIMSTTDLKTYLVVGAFGK